MADTSEPAAPPLNTPSPLRTTRNAPRRHASEPRGLSGVPSSPLFEGRFGRMFRNLPVFSQTEDALERLADLMVSPPEDAPTPEGEVDPEETTKPIPAGFTYLGQFIDHDITFDPVSVLDRQNDPDALVDFRTPRFDLDSLYGRGPADQPYLYDQEHAVANGVDKGLLFLLGKPVSDDPRFAGPDLARNGQGRALIGDPRNDENLIVSQLQTVMLRFHNRMLGTVAGETGLTDADLLKETQRRVRWHYQWVIFNDFLPRIVGREMLDTVLPLEERTIVAGSGKLATVSARRPNLQFYKPKNNAYMPVEFSGAAYRFGHSMVRPIYRFNSKIPRVPPFSPNLEPGNLENLNGFRPLPQEWGFEWMFFFELGGNPDRKPMQKAYRIDTQLVNPLGLLPPAVADKPRSLARRNLLRGFRLGLPSGQTVARAMAVPPIGDDDLLVGAEGKEVKIASIDAGFKQNAPLWYYILREADLFHEGNQLGPVGGRIVAEVFAGILVADRMSYINVDPLWEPTLSPGRNFAMRDLIKFAIES